MNQTPALTPFQRGQAAYACALACITYADGSDELLDWQAGLCAATGGWGPAVLATTDTLASCEALHRQALDEMHEKLASLQGANDALHITLQSMARSMAPVVVAFLQQDADRLASELGKLVASHVKVAHQPAAGVLQ